MKKLAKILCVLAFCVVSAFSLVACNDPFVTGAQVKRGTLETTVVRGEQLDTTNTVVVLTYKNGATKEVSGNGLSYSNVDTSTVGDKTLKITCVEDNYTFNVTIKVVASEADVNSIESLDSNLIIDFNQKRTSTDESTRFAEGSDQKLYVGSQNEFNFRITATGFDSNDNRVVINKVRTIVKIEILRDSAYQLLSDGKVEQYVAIDTENNTFNFTDNANGHDFRITVKAANVSDTVTDENQVKFTQEVSVIDAYNVYNAKQLSAYDNRTDDFWKAIKTEIGLYNETTNTYVQVSNVILQDDITVTAEDVPDTLFWKETSPNYSTAAGKVGAENLLGTPIDAHDNGVYYRNVAPGHNFEFIGNYFRVDYSSFPQMVVSGKGDGRFVKVNGDESSAMSAHLSLFYTTTEDEITAPTNAEWKNIAFYGNGALASEAPAIYKNSGGLILMKNDTTNFVASYNVVNNCQIAYFFELGEATNPNDGNFRVEKCRGFNAYQCFFYLWGTEQTTIVDSEFKNSGGPVIMADHAHHKPNGDGGYAPHVDVIACDLESKLTGKEPWFSIYPGTSALVSQITLLDAAYLTDTKSIVAGKAADGTLQLNVIGLIKSGSSEDITATRVQGYIRIFDTDGDYTSYYEDDIKTTYGLDLDKGVQSHKSGANLIDVALGSMQVIPPEGEGKAPTVTGNVYLQENKEGRYVDATTAMAVGQTKNPYEIGQDSTVNAAGERMTANSNYVNVYLYLGMGVILGTANRAA